VMMRLPSELGPVGILALICTCAGVSSLFFFFVFSARDI
jgi:hypothetical protein